MNEKEQELDEFERIKCIWDFISDEHKKEFIIDHADECDLEFKTGDYQIEDIWEDMNMYEQIDFIKEKADELGFFVEDKWSRRNDDDSDVIETLKDIYDKFKQEGEDTLYNGEQVMKMLVYVIKYNSSSFKIDLSVDKSIKAIINN